MTVYDQKMIMERRYGFKPYDVSVIYDFIDILKRGFSSRKTTAPPVDQQCNFTGKYQVYAYVIHMTVREEHFRTFLTIFTGYD